MKADRTYNNNFGKSPLFSPFNLGEREEVGVL